MLSLLLALTVAAPSTRVSYEAKCLYCHSAEVAESQKLSELGWRKLIDRMRMKAPLLISKADVPVLARFMVGTLQLGVAAPVVASKPPEPVPVKPDPTKPPEPFKPEYTPIKVPDFSSEPTAPPLPEVDPAELELASRASGLIEKRCSKCHTLGRVYGKLDSLERSLTTLERMRFKTGSGISQSEFEVLDRYLRTQF